MATAASPRDSASASRVGLVNFNERNGAMSFTPRHVTLRGTTDLHGVLIRPGIVSWEGGAVTRIQPGAVSRRHVLIPAKSPVSRRVECAEPVRVPLDRDGRDAKAFREMRTVGHTVAAPIQAYRPANGQPVKPWDLWRWQRDNGLPTGCRKFRLPTQRTVIAPDEVDAAIGSIAEVADGFSLPWSEYPTVEALAVAYRTLRRQGNDLAEQARAMLGDAREGERTFLTFDSGDPAYGSIGKADDGRDALDATWRARNTVWDTWEVAETQRGFVSDLMSKGPLPRRAIGTLAGDLAAKHHRLREYVIVHDRRAVTLRQPVLAVDGLDTYKLAEKPATRSKFYDSAEEAAAAVERIKRTLIARGNPVRTWRPDPLADSDRLSESTRKWRARQRELLRTTHTVLLPGGRKLRCRKATHLRGISSLPVSVVEAHNPNRKEVAA